MFINTGYEITNTPSQFVAAYNTWPYQPPKSEWYQHVPQYYINHAGRVVEWDRWNPPQLMSIPGGQYKGTPTRTGAFYAKNTIVDPRPKTQNYSGCGCRK
jgi:hypothetical protein